MSGEKIITNYKPTLNPINKYFFLLLLTYILVAFNTFGQQSNPIFKKGYYKNHLSLSPRAKFSPCNDVFVLREVNRLYNEDTNAIVPAHIDSNQLGQIDSCIRLIDHWPLNIREYFWRSVARVYFVDNYQYSARTIPIDKNTFIIILNSQLLKLSPNEWATKKEHSTFVINDQTTSLEMFIDDNTSPAATIENILIHELGHIVSAKEKLLPLSYRKNSAYIPKQPFRTEFYTKGDTTFRTNKNLFLGSICYYSKNATLSFDQYSEELQKLNNTTYPTMYSTINEDEYFAELFYSEFHCHFQNKPYQYFLLKKDNESQIILNGILQERCNKQHSHIHELILKLN